MVPFEGIMKCKASKCTNSLLPKYIDVSLIYGWIIGVYGSIYLGLGLLCPHISWRYTGCKAPMCSVQVYVNPIAWVWEITLYQSIIMMCSKL